MPFLSPNQQCQSTEQGFVSKKNRAVKQKAKVVIEVVAAAAAVLHTTTYMSIIHTQHMQHNSLSLSILTAIFQVNLG